MHTIAFICSAMDERPATGTCQRDSRWDCHEEAATLALPNKFVVFPPTIQPYAKPAFFRTHPMCIIPRLAATILAIVTLTAATARAAEPTVILITDKTLVEGTVPFGINLGGDAYYSGAALTKLRAHETFEGTTYRQCHFGPVNDAHGATTWFPLNDDWKQMMLDGGRYTILSGPSRGTTGRIKGISSRSAEHNGKTEEFMYFEYDREVTPDEPNMGLLIECDRTGDGQMHTRDGYWCSKHNRIAVGDVHPGAFGCAALNLRGSEGRAHYRFGTHYQRYGETNGRWHVRFWAKAKTGSAATHGRHGSE